MLTGGVRGRRPLSTRREHAEFPLVISDVRMPGQGRASGSSTELRELHPDTAVIMLTAFGDTEAAVECLRNGAADYLLKPPQGRPSSSAPSSARSGGGGSSSRASATGGASRTACARRPPSSRATLARPRGDLLADALDARRGARRARARDERPLAARRPLHARRRGAARHRRDGAARHRPRRAAPRHRQDRRARRDPPEARRSSRPTSGARCASTRRSASTSCRRSTFLDVPGADRALRTRSASTAAGYPRGLAGEAIPIGARIFAIADTLRRDDERPPVPQGRHASRPRAPRSRAAPARSSTRAAPTRSCRCRRTSSPSSRARRRAAHLTEASRRRRGGRRRRRSEACGPATPPRMIWTAPIGYKGPCPSPMLRSR